MKQFLTRRILVACIALPLAFLEGCESTGPLTEGGAWQNQVERTRRALIAAGDSDSLSAAALISDVWGKHDPDRLELMHRAALSDPARVDLAWLDYQVCTFDSTCDPTPLMARVQSLDPNNAASWIGDSRREEKMPDEAKMNDAIEKMASTNRFDIEWVTIIRNLVNAIQRTNSMDLSATIVTAAGFAGAVAIPPYAGLASACRGEALGRSRRLIDCQRLARAMRRGDALVTEMIGIAIALRVWPEGSPEYLDAMNARRTERYRMGLQTEVLARHNWNASFSRKYLDWLSSCKSEQELLVASILNVGLDPNPPSGWKEPIREGK